MQQKIMFDFGNVVFDTSFDNIFKYWSVCLKTNKSEIEKKFTKDFAYFSFCQGLISSKEYYLHIKNDLKIEISEADFFAGWERFYSGLKPDIEQTLLGLKKLGYYLCALSNTNEIHVKYIQKHYPQILNQFDRIFYSNEMNVRKPDKKTFQIVLDFLKCDSRQFIFLDDKEENINAAEALGFNCILVKNSIQMKNELMKALKINIFHSGH